MREVYPATFRLIGVSKGLEPRARAAEAEAARLNKQDAPRREAEQARAEADRRAAAERQDPRDQQERIQTVRGN